MQPSSEEQLPLPLAEVLEGGIVPIGASKWEGDRNGDYHLWLYYKTDDLLIAFQLKNGELWRVTEWKR